MPLTHSDTLRNGVAKMTDKLQIIVGGQIDTSEQSTSLVTTLYIDDGGVCFPDHQWTDFTDVLHMGSYTLLKHSGKSKANFVLYFMDGPFRLDVKKEKDRKLTIQCVHFRNEAVVKATISCDYVDLLSAIHRALGNLNRMLREKGMSEGKYKSGYAQTIITMKSLEAVIGKQ